MHLAYIDPGSGYILTSGIGYLVAIAVTAFGVILLRVKQLVAFCLRHRRLTVLVLGLAAAGALTCFGFYHGRGGHMYDVQHPLHGRVIILGMDGMTPDIVEPLMRAGKLPHFAQLQQQGSYRHLATTNPPQSPVAWTGFATGQNPGQHGLFDFIARDPKTYMPALATSKMEGATFKPVVKCKRFWDYATELGVESVIIDCPITFPPDNIRGRMLSGMGVPDILGTEGTFTFYTSEPTSNTDTGGRVAQVPYASRLTVELYGPRRPVSGGQIDNAKTPMLVLNEPEHNRVQLEIQDGKRFTLPQGQWSEWQHVTFSLGLFKKIKGIVQFYLVETKPELKLYASPINFDPREPYFLISSPPGYAKELAERVGLYYTQGMPCDTWSLNENRLSDGAFLARVASITDTKEQMLDLELKRMHQGIVFAYFEATDVVQHMFWRNLHYYADPASPIYAKHDAPPDAIMAAYIRMDTLLGKVMGQMAPHDVLLVLSDHGFGSFQRSVHLNTWLRHHGYLTLKDPHAESGGDLLKDIDWTKTRAYALGFGAVYLNQQGREAHGIVKPGEETEALKKELIAKLAAWTDDRDGAPVVSKVYPKEEIFWGAHADEAPDLFVGFHKGYRASWQTATGAVPAQLIEDNKKKWSGDHLFDPVLVPGILFSNQHVQKDHPSIYDLTPTILHAIGGSDALLQQCRFDGEPLWR